MATLEREFSARWGVDEVFRYFRDGILAGEPVCYRRGRECL